ncbi:MAG: RNA-metabolising metallo-beta-lactamase [Alphaproteobacteria bacterium]|nr:RNA-metabolising metallo-beta-lactamase [Alphaproteobacteria bacterium]MDF3033149.1 RNA-metabolising metallo-beta-lactamase [Alphaproteobacteria bacterium]
MKDKPTEQDFWFLPLGGAGEIGMNLNLYAHDGQWLMVDLGITFGDRLGVDVITPDPTFIAERQDALAGLIITHAHEDHVGAVPYLWPLLKCPVYATPFTASILRQKLKDKPWGKQVPIIEVPLSGTVQVGKFSVEFITLTHSIPEPNALAITTPLGTVLHTGDWKIDGSPFVGEVTDHTRLEELGDQGVLAMVCDSTNVFTEGTSGSEEGVRDGLTALVGRHPEGRVVVACFASNVARLETAAIAARANGRQPVLVGRSLIRMEEAARQNGYLKGIPPFLDEDKAEGLPRDQVLLIATGSQGEPRSALARIASDQHPAVHLDAGDTVIFSSRMIPGNERSISALQNRLVLRGIKVITAHEEDIHVSGHPARDELRQMYAWVRPHILVPVHGEARHLQAQAALGLECGIPQAVIPENGSLIHLAPGLPKIMDQVPTGRFGLDGNRLVPMNSLMLRDRVRLSVQGTIVVTIALDKKGQPARPIHLTMLGVAEPGEEMDDVSESINRVIRQILNEAQKNDEARLEALRVGIRRVVNSRLGKKPLTEVHLIQV